MVGTTMGGGLQACPAARVAAEVEVGGSVAVIVAVGVKVGLGVPVAQPLRTRSKRDRTINFFIFLPPYLIIAEEGNFFVPCDHQ